MNLTVVNGLDGLMHVHKAGCRDLPKIANRSNGQYDMAACTTEELIREIWTDFIDEWEGDLRTGQDLTKIYPCANLEG